MNENLNLVEILKDCPKGTKLYCTVYGEVELYRVDYELEYPISVKNKKQGIAWLSSDGRLNRKLDGECILFPSKDQRDWSKFKPIYEFKDGDIVATNTGNWIGITTGGHAHSYMPTYCVLSHNREVKLYFGRKEEWGFNRLATEVEKQRLFDAIKELGYKWNAETKTLEKLVEPRFKVGDWVVFITSKSVYKVEKKENYEYTLRHILGGSMCLPFSNEKLIREWTIEDAKDGDVLVNGSNIFIFHFINNRRLMGYCHVNMNNGNFYNDIGRNECFCTIDAQVTPATKEQRDALMKAMNDNGYEWDDETKTLKKLVKHKFDPSTLKPFDRVLVRLTRDCIWNVTFFSHYDKEVNWGCCPCVTTSCKSYNKCIPYNDETKHLLGTSDEAPEYYRYWED